jgi:inhibitor of KinA sporulation pathway (predicted exonuclease)
MESFKKRYVVLDLESTCYENNDKNKPFNFINEIIEIGAVILDENGKELSQFNQFIKPIKFPILSNFCKQLTTIKQDDIEFAYSFNVVIENFFNWIYTNNTTGTQHYPVTFVSWGHYDKNQLQKDSKLHNIDVLNWIDDNNHISLKHKYTEWNKLKKGIGLGSACNREKIEFKGTHHRGISDALMVAEIFKLYLYKFQETAHKEPNIHKTNYLQNIPDSQFYNDLYQIMYSLKVDTISKVYIIKGIENTIKNGYKLIKTNDTNN